MRRTYDVIAQSQRLFRMDACVEVAQPHPMAKPQQSKSALALKRLRERTPLSVQDVADGLGKPKSTYASYEDKYKKEHIPLDLARALIPIFGKHGVERGEILALAGVPDAFEGDVAADRNLDEMAQIAEVNAIPSAGAGSTVQETEVMRTWVIPGNVVSIATEATADRIKIVRVKGDSMIPTFNPLDRIMVDTTDTVPSPGGVFVVWDGLGFVVKRVQLVPHSEPLKVKITSDNPKFDPYERTLGEAYIQGRVIGKWMWT